MTARASRGSSIHLRIGPSRSLAVTLGAAYATAIGCVLVIALPLWTRVAAALVLACCAAATIHRLALLRASNAITEVEAGEGRAVSYLERGGVWQVSRLLDTSFVSPRLTVLNLRSDATGSVRNLVITPDNTDAEAFRRLRVLLRWSKGWRDEASPAGPGPQ